MSGDGSNWLCVYRENRSDVAAFHPQSDTELPRNEKNSFHKCFSQPLGPDRKMFYPARRRLLSSVKAVLGRKGDEVFWFSAGF